MVGNLEGTKSSPAMPHSLQLQPVAVCIAAERAGRQWGGGGTGGAAALRALLAQLSICVMQTSLFMSRSAAAAAGCQHQAGQL